MFDISVADEKPVPTVAMIVCTLTPCQIIDGFLLGNIMMMQPNVVLLPFYLHSCGLSTATIEYSCPSACLSVCVSFRLCVCVCVHDNSKNNGSFHLKLEHIVVYENSSDDFDIGHCPIKVKVTA